MKIISKKNRQHFQIPACVVEYVDIWAMIYHGQWFVCLLWLKASLQRLNPCVASQATAYTTWNWCDQNNNCFIWLTYSAFKSSSPTFPRFVSGLYAGSNYTVITFDCFISLSCYNYRVMTYNYRVMTYKNTMLS